MIKEFTKYVESQVASLTMSGTQNLFAGRRPQSAPDVCAVVEEPFPDPTDRYLPDRAVKTFRIECRGEVDNYFSARDLAVAIHDAIHGDTQVSLPVVGGGPTYIASIYGTEPSAATADEQRRPRVSLYFDVITQEG